MIPTQALLESIVKHAKQYDLDPAVVYGICQQESNFMQNACRFEKNYKWLYKPESVKTKNCSTETEEIFQKVSWGVMQVMGAVYREYGYTDVLPLLLLDRESQISYGCKHLAEFKRRFSDGLDYIAAYNAGSPRKLSSGKYVNQKYVDNVLSFAKDFNARKEQFLDF